MGNGDKKFTKDHEWLSQEGDIFVCGITDHAQEMLTEIVFVELPETGENVDVGDRVAVVESVKAVSDVFSPASGEIIEVNTKLEDTPELLNSDPYGEGWIFKIKTEDDLDELMNSGEYTDFINSGA